MKIGIASAARNAPHRSVPLAQLYREAVGEAVVAEELGFDHYWVSEHHFAEDQWSPSPIPLLGAIAARTRTIRMGPFVLLLGLYNPVKVAEDIAVLDALSNGRIDFVVGPKPQDPEVLGFGIDPETAWGRAYEGLEIIERCWTGERFSYHGKYFSIDNAEVTTTPTQAHIPIYTAALGPQSLALSAKRGYGQASALHGPFWDSYPQRLVDAGRNPADVPIISGPLGAYVAPTRDQAWDEAERGLHWWVEFYRKRGAPFPLPPVEELRHTPGVGVYGIPFYVGTPEEVLEQMSVYRDAPIDELNVQLHHPGQPADEVEACMRLFAKECAPVMREWGSR
jgi:alkanesulfonate monooxygenase SsuD/methylene tetrahydromethanopterin reductase-like flavin-dependent oxidoreductase (luciferase family)